MVFLKSYFLCLLLLFLCSCSKVSYLTKQGIGQLSILQRARPNDEVIKDVTVSKKYKEKIKLIGIYKDYFYKYWGKKTTSIYSKTTFLENDAVTYLVTASKHNYISPYRVKFPFMGSFPYLGFFDLDSAKEYQHELEQKDYVTFIRPVYAYSTLGYFTDTILTSFFKYDDDSLAELIFHELFHTIFFIKDEVGLNENLANYFAVRMTHEYFKKTSSSFLIKEKKIKKNKLIKKEMNHLVKKLNNVYESKRPKNKDESKIILNEFLADVFMPHMRSFCLELKIEERKCYPLHRKWNNARFVGFLTYEEDGNKLEVLQKKLGKNLFSFYNYIENQYHLYKEGDLSMSFKKYLLKDL